MNDYLKDPYFSKCSLTAEFRYQAYLHTVSTRFWSIIFKLPLVDMLWSCCTGKTRQFFSDMAFSFSVTNHWDLQRRKCMKLALSQTNQNYGKNTWSFRMKSQSPFYQTLRKRILKVNFCLAIRLFLADIVQRTKNIVPRLSRLLLLKNRFNFWLKFRFRILSTLVSLGQLKQNLYRWKQ